jgi:NitT/TauT family transport system substrate-binding protein
VAYPSVVDMEDIPTVMAHELLSEQGYRVTPTFFAQSELAVEALASGDADFGNGADRTFWAAVSQGAPIVTIMEQAANSWAIFAVPEIQTCEDLGGMRFAQHSEGAVSKAMSDAYLLENCPDTEPEILIIPGSENRAAALMAGEIDASPVELADAVQIELERPGDFHILTNFAIDVPKLKTTGMYVNANFAEEHPEVVKDYIKAVLTVHRQINEDHDLLIKEAQKWLAIDPEVLPKVVEAQFAANSWDVNGGLDEDAIQFSIDFFTNSGSLEPGLTVDGVADLSYLNEVLDEIGRQ